MGCFSVLRPKKRRSTHALDKRPPNRSETPPVRLPEPEAAGPSLQSAPPSFRNRGRTSSQSSVSSRARTLSAPSSLVLADQDTISSASFYDQEESKSKAVIKDEHRYSNALPLPLPSPEDSRSPSTLKNWGSFKTTSNFSGPLDFSGPLPLPPLSEKGLRNFSYEEVSVACQHFSADRCVSEGISVTTYKATFGDELVATKKIEATVTRLLASSQSLKEFVNAVNMLASLRNPNLCKLIGFHAQEGSSERMLVYERLHHGSLDRLLHGRSDGGPAMDWSTRIKVALSAARGLAFLHDEGPFQAMYNEFSTANIQIDKDFTAKLSGYGCVTHNADADISNTSTATASLAVETLEKGLLTPKSNVWSYGIVLLELITGRKNLDPRYPKEERNLIKWSKPYLTDDCRLSLIMDPKIKGRFPLKAARTVADMILKCLQKDPSERPTMRFIADSLVRVQDMKYPCKYPLQEPGKVMMKSPSFNGIVVSAPLPPPRACASMVITEDGRVHTSAMRRPASPPPMMQGF
ncbi:Protein kinase superfamily protein [Rhynchospora pubera]|uniref:Protein kinase superfamily protein n=1 Tax=Rhynchospora pubera TaxID=906938 RepID=A0AAV8C728_9POAL|nr:Protein kinase superfamily protein [Rhynchospora pubera]KAJ4767101.1 Protein kinase superfamily protein [Rhynchospora pubera]